MNDELRAQHTGIYHTGTHHRFSVGLIQKILQAPPILGQAAHVLCSRQVETTWYGELLKIMN